MTLTAAEQYAIELINRARMNPLAEQARMGIALNQGLPSGGYGPITTNSKQVLAPIGSLDLSATRHSEWMIATDTFSHTGANGSDPGSRMTAAGYSFTGNFGWAWGENLALASLGGNVTMTSFAEVHHGVLYRSELHRANFFDDDFREIGIGQVVGDYNGRQTSVSTHNFAMRTDRVYVTGVAYNDRNGNDFYNIGEGTANLRLAIEGGSSTATAAAGGYALVSAPTGLVTVQVGPAANATRVTLNLSGGNIKLDVVDGNTLFTNGTMTLLSGPIRDAMLLGMDAKSLSGNTAANKLTGNLAGNSIWGGAGNDLLNGQGGNDNLYGGLDSDRMLGGAGVDRLNGGTGADRLTGGAGADRFEFDNNTGFDRVLDFALGQGDRLRLDDALWGGGLSAAQVVGRHATVGDGAVTFAFGGGDAVQLLGITSLNGLAAAIDIF